MRKELIIIRDKVNALLDAIDGAPKGSSTAAGEEVRVQAPATQTPRPAGGETTGKPEGMLHLFDPF